MGLSVAIVRDFVYHLLSTDLYLVLDPIVIRSAAQ